MYKPILLMLLSLLFLSSSLKGQLQQEKEVFTEQDTLRGSITPERAWLDLNYWETVKDSLKFYKD